MKTMKTLLTLCLTLAMLAALILPTSADVIFEPEGDSFFQEHRDECEHGVGRAYLANTADGFVILYESPISSRVIDTYPNGERLYIEWYYTDANGERWGITYQENGWLRISDLSLIYDVYSFSEEHGADFVPYVKGSFTITASEEQPVVLYNYPGGSIERRSFTDPNFLNVISDTYTDESGRVWGHYQGYYMGHTNGWICLSDPYNTSLSSSAGNTESNEGAETGGNESNENTSTENEAHGKPVDEILLKADPITPTPEQISAAQNGGGVSQPNDPTLLIVAGILIGLVMILTGVLIAVLFRRRECK